MPVSMSGLPSRSPSSCCCRGSRARSRPAAHALAAGVEVLGLRTVPRHDMRSGVGLRDDWCWCGGASAIVVVGRTAGTIPRGNRGLRNPVRQAWSRIVVSPFRSQNGPEAKVAKVSKEPELSIYMGTRSPLLRSIPTLVAPASAPRSPGVARRDALRGGRVHGGAAATLAPADPADVRDPPRPSRRRRRPRPGRSCWCRGSRARSRGTRRPRRRGRSPRPGCASRVCGPGGGTRPGRARRRGGPGLRVDRPGPGDVGGVEGHLTRSGRRSRTSPWQRPRGSRAPSRRRSRRESQWPNSWSAVVPTYRPGPAAVGGPRVMPG